MAALQREPDLDRGHVHVRLTAMDTYVGHHSAARRVGPFADGVLAQLNLAVREHYGAFEGVNVANAFPSDSQKTHDRPYPLGLPVLHE